MSNFDPTDPWGDVSPWDATSQTQPPATQEPPVATPPVAVVDNQESVTLSFKGGTGYDASLLVIRAASLSEMNEKLTREAAALRSVLEKAAKVQAYNTSLNSSDKTTQPAGTKPQFQNGKIINQPVAAPAGDSCPHGRTLREGNGAKGPWAAMFCNERNKAAQCPPLWRQKDGTFA